MFLRQIYDDRLAQAAYLIGCQRTGEAILFDPERDIDRYLELAARNKLSIVAVAETHIHADFLSGAREIAERAGAHLYLSARGGPDWSYTWLDRKIAGGNYDHTLLKDNDTFSIGLIEFRAVHTPGHTPEHICYLVTDRGGGADDPMGVISGDFVFVGALGRPDLLETAAGIQGVKEDAARQLYESAVAFQELAPHLQVWPAHGAGSACGKSLGAVPQSTVGYEVRHNAQLKLTSDQRAFVASILEGQPEPPMYFARMKALNRDGAPILGELPHPQSLDAAGLGALSSDVVVLDARPWDVFRAGHIPGSIHAPLDNLFANVAGSYVNPGDDVCLIAPDALVDELTRVLVRIGIDNVKHHANPETLTAALTHITPGVSKDVDAGAAAGDADSLILDVRGASEYALGHVPDALNIAYTRLPDRLNEIPIDRPILVHCAGGVRSTRAVSYLQALGYDVTNVGGGFAAWIAAGGAVVGQPEPAGAG